MTLYDNIYIYSYHVFNSVCIELLVGSFVKSAIFRFRGLDVAPSKSKGNTLDDMILTEDAGSTPGKELALYPLSLLLTAF